MRTTIFFILFIGILFTVLIFNKYYPKKQHFNTLEKTKKNVLKCCDSDDCPGKPPYLNKSNCNENKKKAILKLKKNYKKTFSVEEYNKLKNKKVSNKRHERVTVIGLDELLNKKIDNDTRDEHKPNHPNQTNYFLIKDYQSK